MHRSAATCRLPSASGSREHKPRQVFTAAWRSYKFKVFDINGVDTKPSERIMGQRPNRPNRLANGIAEAQEHKRLNIAPNERLGQTKDLRLRQRERNINGGHMAKQRPMVPERPAHHGRLQARAFAAQGASAQNEGVGVTGDFPNSPRTAASRCDQLKSDCKRRCSSCTQLRDLTGSLRPQRQRC